MRDLFPTVLVAKVKPNINSVEVHPQLSNDGHPVDGALAGALVQCGHSLYLQLPRCGLFKTELRNSEMNL